MTEKNPQSLTEIMSKERDRLTKRREELTEELSQLEKELAGITAYYDAIEGRITQTKPRGPRSSSSPRAPRGSRQQSILEHLQKNADGLTRGEIIEQMGVKGDKSAEQSISNALNALTKTNKVGKHGSKYVAA
jgi:Fe2+ or Zn2+ uptake regulation protein